MDLNHSPLRFDLLAISELIQPGERVLDLGCGDGSLLRYLIDTKHIVGRGVELTQEGVLACIRKGVSVRQGDLHEGLGDYPDESFDTVILSYTIPYLNDPLFVIREMLRIGQRAIVSFPNWGHWRCRLDFLLKGQIPIPSSLPQPWYVSPRARPLTIRDFEEFCEQNQILISRTVFLEGERKIMSQALRNLRATTAIFELR